MQPPVHPITAGSAKLPVWLIKEAEETLENNRRGRLERQWETGISYKGLITKFHCTHRTRHRLKEEQEEDISRSVEKYEIWKERRMARIR